MGCGGSGPAAFLQGDPEADNHDVLPLLGIANRFDSQFPLEADAPLAAVDDKQPSGVGAVTSIGDFSVGVSQAHLFRHDDGNTFHRSQLTGQHSGLRAEFVQGSEIVHAEGPDKGVNVADIHQLRRTDPILS